MKNALLSLAVIAASSGYVVYQNHTTQSLSQDNASALILPSDASKDGSDLSVPAAAAVGSADSAPAAQPATAPPPPSVRMGSALPAPSPAEEGDDPRKDVAANVFSTPAPPPAPPISQAAPVVAPASPPQVAAAAAEPAAPAMPLPRPRPADAPSIVVASQSAQNTGAFRDGTYQGSSANAYYGRVQVEAVIQGGQLVNVKILDYPSDRRTSRAINSRALPGLEREAIQAQSAEIDAVSGATLTSEAFMQSLDSALAQASGGASGGRGRA
jgi:uncharacterized protein with FMN-binding domain